MSPNSAKDTATVLKEARSAAGRAYRSIGNAMSQMSPTADQNSVRYAVAQLDAASIALRPLALGEHQTTLAAAESEAEWYFVDYSMRKSAECPTGRDSLRLKAHSEADAMGRAAVVLDERGLGFKARLNSARRDVAS